MKKFAIRIGLLGAMLVSASNLFAEHSENRAKIFRTLDRELTALVTDEHIVGGQVVLAQNGKILFSRGYGTVAIGSKNNVDNKTLFLIGSCSKPLASACVLSLIGDRKVSIELDDEIDRWIPEFSNMKVTGAGAAKRSPTVIELMNHSAGIYSQKVGMTKPQARLIRSYDQSLAASVEGIASFDLLDQPGRQYAYSGAGYCLLGRVAELAAEKPFEEIMQERLCRPLKLSRTTFFPAERFQDHEIATGAGRRFAPHMLGKKHRFPLVGGSLYSTAEEMTRFEQAVLMQWKSRPRLPHISPQLIQEIGRTRKPNRRYNLGWAVRGKKDSLPRLSHGGSLQSYRAYLSVDLESGISAAGCWTLAKPRAKIPGDDFLKRAMSSLLASDAARNESGVR